MSELCKKCGICCKLIPVIENKMIRDGNQPLPNFLSPLSLNDAQNINESYVKNVQNCFNNVCFYTCKYLSETNTCTHPNKPEYCKDFPATHMAFIPDECGFVGEVFLKQEKFKQKIRRLKEEILYYQTMIKENPKDSKNYQRIIDAHNRFINKFSSYGSELW